MKTLTGFLILALTTSLYADAKTTSTKETNLKSLITEIFKNCEHTEDNFDQKLTLLKALAEKWAEKLNTTETKKHLYESTLEGQLLTLIVPHIIPADMTIAKMAKSCWAEYEDWRRNFAATKDSTQEKRDYKTWQLCVKSLYKDKLLVMDLIDSCRPKPK